MPLLHFSVALFIEDGHFPFFTFFAFIGSHRSWCGSFFFFLFFLNTIYIHNIFTTLLQQIIDDKLLHIIIGRQKSNFNDRFKLEPITTYYLWFVVNITLLFIYIYIERERKNYNLLYVVWLYHNLVYKLLKFGLKIKLFGSLLNSGNWFHFNRI